MMTQQDLKQVKEYVVGILPQLLREEPEILVSIEGIIAHEFPRRDEFTRLLEEVKLQREETNQRLVLLERRVELLEKNLQLLREEMDRRFEEVNRRFDLLHEEMNRRFEQVDKRFEQVDKRLEQMDRRIDLLHEEMNRRFEQVDKRFEQVDKRFEQVDKRFEQVDKRFEQAHHEHLELKRRVIKIESSVDKVLDKMEKFDAWLKVISGDQGTEKGQMLEDLFALALQYGLKNPDIKPETIKLRQELVDTKGQVFLRKNFATEIDLIAENGKLTVFEIKASAEKSDVESFALKVQLVQLQNPDQQVKGVFISPGMSEAVIQRCIENEIEPIA